MLDALADRVDADTERLAIGGVSDGASYALSIGLTNGDVFPTVPPTRPAFWSCPTARTARLPIRRLDDNVAAARMGAGCEERAGDAEARLGQPFAD